METGLSRPRSRLWAGCLAATLCAGPWANGQTPAPATRPPTGQPGADAPPADPFGQSNTFADEPFRLEEVGLTLRIPAGTVVQSSSVGQARVVQIAAPDGAWHISIHTPKTGSPDATVGDAADRTLRELLLKDVYKDQRTGQDVASQGVILERVRDLRIPGSPTSAERFYIARPRPLTSLTQAHDGARIVQGFTIFKPLPDQFVVFELVCDERAFASARQPYELSVATARFEDPATVNNSRRDLIRMGKAVLTRLGSDDYSTAMAGGQQWLRIYKPAPSGSKGDAEELGYRGLRFFTGTRAQIDPKAPRGTPARDNPEGFLSEITARQISRALVGGAIQTIDIQATYFTTPDGQEEAWSLRMAQWQGKGRPPVVFTETGARTGRNMTVLVDEPGKPSRTIKPVFPDEGYISQVETHLLPRLLVRAGVETDAGFYAYRSESTSITLRRDTMSRDSSMPGVWVITSRPAESAEPLTYRFREDGTLIRSEQPGGVVAEPMALEEIVQLWNAKGLPTGSMAR